MSETPKKPPQDPYEALETPEFLEKTERVYQMILEEKAQESMKKSDSPNSDEKKDSQEPSPKRYNPILTKALLLTLQKREARRQQERQQFEQMNPVSDLVM